MSAELRDFRAKDCPDCHGDGWIAETTADPDEDGQPGEPYQYQRACAHPLLWKPLLDERDAAIRRAEEAERVVQRWENGLGGDAAMGYIRAALLSHPADNEAAATPESR